MACFLTFYTKIFCIIETSDEPNHTNKHVTSIYGSSRSFLVLESRSHVSPPRGKWVIVFNLGTLGFSKIFTKYFHQNHSVSPQIWSLLMSYQSKKCARSIYGVRRAFLSLETRSQRSWSRGKCKNLQFLEPNFFEIFFENFFLNYVKIFEKIKVFWKNIDPNWVFSIGAWIGDDFCIWNLTHIYYDFT